MNSRQERELAADSVRDHGEELLIRDAADDGPEVDLIRLIDGRRSNWEERQERLEYAIHTQQAVSAAHGELKP